MIFKVMNSDAMNSPPYGAFWGRRLLVSFVACTVAGLVSLTPAQARQEAAYVIDASTNEVLHANNADATIHPASLTKMMTLYLLFDALSRGELQLATQMSVSRRAANREPSRLGLQPGQTISVRDSIGALVIKSANDVATVVAEKLGGSETQFAVQMTEKARQLGMASTTFRNASGLHDNRQVSTARDMARLGRALFEHFPQYYGYFSAEEFRYGGRTYTTHNNLVSDYDGADGIKTGYVRASGFNVVTSAQKNGRRLIGVVIGGENARIRDRQMQRLLDASFALATSRAHDRSTENQALALSYPTNMAGNLTSVMRPHRRPNTRLYRADGPVILADLAPNAENVTSSSFVTAMVARRPDSLRATPAPSAARNRPSNIGPLADASRQQLVAAIFQTERRPTAPTADASGEIPLYSESPASESPDRAKIRSVSSTRTDERLWGIQVGAFGSAATAERYAIDTATNLPISLLPTAQVQTVQVNGQDLFRARLFGLSEVEAQVSCGHLMDQGKSCMLVSPAGANVSASTIN